MTREVIRADHADATLIAMLRENKNNAIELIYKKYWKELVQYAYSYLRDWDSAEEMVQKIFINIYVKDISFNEGLYLSRYLYKAVKNEISNHLRKQSVYQRHVFQSSSTSEISMDHALEIVESFDVKIKINRAVNAIPEKIRVVYLLNREQQLTIKQISKKLKRPEDTIDKQLRRAIYFLRTSLNALLV